MRKLSALLVAMAVTSTGVQAADLITIPGVTVSGNVAMTSNYKFRGEDQTSDSFATQGGLTFTHDSGAYVAAWGSGVTFASGSEIDVMLGYGTAVGEGSVDVGVMQYIYPNSSNTSTTDYDFTEVYASYGLPTGVVKGDKFKLSAAYSPDYFAETGSYYRVGVDYSLPVGPLGLQVAAAYNDIGDITDGTYVDYKAAVNYTVNGVVAEVAYVGGEGDLRDAYDIAGNSALDGKAIFTLSKAF